MVHPGFTLYGIPTCDATKKAMGWLQKNRIPFTFHDYKINGIGKEKIRAWFKQEDWQTVFNKRSTAWRELSMDVQHKVLDEDSALEVMLTHTNIIKRPILEAGEKILLVGFGEEQYDKTINKNKK
jgi:Spx/MgsR family transcriptional regulator